MSDTERTAEEQWFHQNEQHLLEAARRARELRERERSAGEGEEQRLRLKEQHFMKCPKCGHDLESNDYLGVEIDRCTFCEGMWVDAGELEQLFTRKDADRKGIFRQLLRI